MKGLLLSTFYLSMSLAYGQHFILSSQNFSGSSALGATYSLESVDVNGDGFKDLLIPANDIQIQNEIWINDTQGNFSLFGTFGSTSEATYFLYAFDADNDLDMDVVELNDNGDTKLYLNDGTGLMTFAQTLSSTSVGYTGRAEAADMDGDTDLDLVIVTSTTTLEVWLNNGLGVFTFDQSNSISDNYALCLGKFDADADTDVYIGGTSSGGTILTNNGSGVLSPSGQSLGTDTDNWTAKTADVDGDFDRDILVATTSGVRIWLNNGFGTFTQGNLIGSNSQSFDLKDVNNDGDFDVIIAEPNGNTFIYQNNGSGLFTQYTAYPMVAGVEVIVTDLNNDNLQDVVINNISSISVYLGSNCPLNNDVQEVCLVTVDSVLADHNIVVWEKPVPMNALIDSFYIYREITTNSYQKIGAVHADSLSIFEDFGANPNTTSYKYKITSLDTCGQESPNTGLYHKSIHLQYSGFGNFQWTFYEIESTANQVASYNFWRDDLGDGNWAILQTVSGSSSSYTDIDYASYPNAIYRVDLNWIGGYICSPTKANINTSRSNKKGNFTPPDPAGLLELLGDLLVVYPNPSNGLIRVQLPITLLGNELVIKDALGKELTRRVIEGETTSFEISDHAAGLYFVQLVTEYGTVAKQVVLE